jgi:hypothetical protein
MVVRSIEMLLAFSSALHGSNVGRTGKQLLVPGLRRREIADHDSCESIDDGHKKLRSCSVRGAETYERDTAADVINDSRDRQSSAIGLGAAETLLELQLGLTRPEDQNGLRLPQLTDDLVVVPVQLWPWRSSYFFSPPPSGGPE